MKINGFDHDDFYYEDHETRKKDEVIQPFLPSGSEVLLSTVNNDFLMGGGAIAYVDDNKPRKRESTPPPFSMTGDNFGSFY